MATVQAETKTFKFHIWERLRLTVGDEGREGTYSCRLSDIHDDRLVISRPQYERGKTLMSDNRIVTVYSIRSDAAYAFSARLKETRPKSADEMYLLELGKIRRVQRRRFVRLDKLIRLKYLVLPRPVKKPIEPRAAEMIASQSINLSAGGLLIPVDTDMAVEDILFLALESYGLGKLPPYMLAACRHTRILENKQQVAGVEFILHEDLPRYLSRSEIPFLPEAALRFDDSMQNELVSELFAEQLVMRQKGIL
jgi:c-di-GMP-binding flagellar brake protein YcgR